MILYVLIIALTNLALGYGLCAFLKRRSQLVAWSAQQATPQTVAAPPAATEARVVLPNVFGNAVDSPPAEPAGLQLCDVLPTAELPMAQPATV